MTAFQDRVAVITGGTGVLGRAVTRLFVVAGARVAVPCRSAEDAQAPGPCWSISSVTLSLTSPRK